jgi:hypothetical protein
VLPVVVSGQQQFIIIKACVPVARQEQVDSFSSCKLHALNHSPAAA